METRIQNDQLLPIDEMSTPNEEPNTTWESDSNIGDRRPSIRRGGSLIFRVVDAEADVVVGSSPEPIDSPNLSSIHSSEELW